MLASGCSARSAISRAATATPEALSFAPWTSEPRSSRSASSARPTAATPRAAASSPRPGRNRDRSGSVAPAATASDWRRDPAPEEPRHRGVKQEPRARAVEMADQAERPAGLPAGLERRDHAASLAAGEQVRHRGGAELALERHRPRRAHRQRGAGAPHPLRQQRRRHRRRQDQSVRPGEARVARVGLRLGVDPGRAQLGAHRHRGDGLRLRGRPARADLLAEQGDPALDVADVLAHVGGKGLGGLHRRDPSARKRAAPRGGPDEEPAATYSPRQLPTKYHRR